VRLFPEPPPQLLPQLPPAFPRCLSRHQSSCSMPSRCCSLRRRLSCCVHSSACLLQLLQAETRWRRRVPHGSGVRQPRGRRKRRQARRHCGAHSGGMHSLHGEGFLRLNGERHRHDRSTRERRRRERIRSELELLWLLPPSQRVATAG
jgi:hypothetical protein